MMVTWDNESQLSIDPSLIGASIETYLHSKLTVGAWVTRPVYLGTSKTQIYIDKKFLLYLISRNIIEHFGWQFWILGYFVFLYSKRDK